MVVAQRSSLVLQSFAVLELRMGVGGVANTLTLALVSGTRFSTCAREADGTIVIETETRD